MRGRERPKDGLARPGGTDDCGTCNPKLKPAGLGTLVSGGSELEYVLESITTSTG